MATAEARKPPRCGRSLSLLLTFGIILVAWTAAWSAKEALDGRSAWVASAAGSFVYWTLAKLVVWIIPAVWLYRRWVGNPRDLARVDDGAATIRWGLLVGTIVALIGVVPRLIDGPAFEPSPSFALMNVLVVAPLLEELLLRGVVLEVLRPLGFWRANGLAAVAFVALHAPGWHFQGVLLRT